MNNERTNKIDMLTNGCVIFLPSASLFFLSKLFQNIRTIETIKEKKEKKIEYSTLIKKVTNPLGRKAEGKMKNGMNNPRE